jgi:hypothetical protein
VDSPGLEDVSLACFCEHCDEPSGYYASNLVNKHGDRVQVDRYVGTSNRHEKIRIHKILIGKT